MLKYEAILNRNNLRNTLFRKKVIDIFLATPHAISVPKLENLLGEHDRITLYRTIKTFLEKGVLHEITMPGEEKKLALCDCFCQAEEEVHHHDHVHFKCNKCNTISCIELENMPQIQLPGFSIDSQEIQLQGVCKNCQP